MAKFTSRPSSVSARACAMHPALFTSTCSGAPDATYAATRSRTARCDDTSHTRRETRAEESFATLFVVFFGTFDSGWVPSLIALSSARIASLASVPLWRSRHTMHTVAPWSASCLAVSYPIPLFAPVTITWRPVKSRARWLLSKDLAARSYPAFM